MPKPRKEFTTAEVMVLQEQILKEIREINSKINVILESV